MFRHKVWRLPGIFPQVLQILESVLDTCDSPNFKPVSAHESNTWYEAYNSKSSTSTWLMNDDAWSKGLKKSYVEYKCKFITSTREETKG